MVEHYIVVVIKLSSRYKDILDIATIWVGTERVVTVYRDPLVIKTANKQEKEPKYFNKVFLIGIELSKSNESNHQTLQVIR